MVGETVQQRSGNSPFSAIPFPADFSRLRGVVGKRGFSQPSPAAGGPRRGKSRNNPVPVLGPLRSRLPTGVGYGSALHRRLPALHRVREVPATAHAIHIPAVGVFPGHKETAAMGTAVRCCQVLMIHGFPCGRSETREGSSGTAPTWAWSSQECGERRQAPPVCPREGGGGTDEGEIQSLQQWVELVAENPCISATRR